MLYRFRYSFDGSSAWRVADSSALGDCGGISAGAIQDICNPDSGTLTDQHGEIHAIGGESGVDCGVRIRGGPGDLVNFYNVQIEGPVANTCPEVGCDYLGSIGAISRLEQQFDCDTTVASLQESST